MLEAYFDESHTQFAFGLGGYLAPADEWKRFNAKWVEFLAGYKLQRFHMADCESQQEEFRGWTVARCHQAVRDAISILNSHSIIGINWGCFLDDYKDHPVPEGQSRPDPYHLCFVKCVALALFEADNFGVDEEIAFLFDRRKKFQHKAHDLFDRMIRQESSSRINARIGLLAFGDSYKVLPLQAADIMAYEARKELENSIRAPHLGPRKSLTGLNRNRIVGVQLEEPDVPTLLNYYFSLKDREQME